MEEQSNPSIVETYNPPPTPENNKSRSNWIKYLLLSLIMLLIGAGLAYAYLTFLAPEDDGKEEDTTITKDILKDDDKTEDITITEKTETTATPDIKEQVTTNPNLQTRVYNPCKISFNYDPDYFPPASSTQKLIFTEGANRHYWTESEEIGGIALQVGSPNSGDVSEAIIIECAKSTGTGVNGIIPRLMVTTTTEVVSNNKIINGVPYLVVDAIIDTGEAMGTFTERLYLTEQNSYSYVVKVITTGNYDTALEYAGLKYIK